MADVDKIIQGIKDKIIKKAPKPSVGFEEEYATLATWTNPDEFKIIDPDGKEVDILSI